MGYIEEWYEDLMTRTSFCPLKEEVEAWGEYYRRAAAIRYARVKISLGPSESLQVIDDLDRDKSAQLVRYGSVSRQGLSGLDQIAFGVLDVLLASLSSPCRCFKLRVLDVDIHEINSVPIAFRLAAREATRSILKMRQTPSSRLR